MEYVVFDPANSYPLERDGDKSSTLIEYQLNMDPVKRIIIR